MKKIFMLILLWSLPAYTETYIKDASSTNTKAYIGANDENTDGKDTNDYTSNNKDVKNNKENLLLWKAINENSSYDTIKALIDAGADVNVKDNNGTTALMYAVYYGNTEIVKTLIAAGADVNAKDNNGFTTLISAANEGNTEIVRAKYGEIGVV